MDVSRFAVVANWAVKTTDSFKSAAFAVTDQKAFNLFVFLPQRSHLSIQRLVSMYPYQKARKNFEATTVPGAADGVVRGVLTPWDAWSPCDVTCGGGIKTRYRACYPLNAVCNGTTVDTKKCSMKTCPGA